MSSKENTTDIIEPQRWYISKEISFALIGWGLLQAGGLVWWAQGMAKQAESNTHRIEIMESQRVAERLAALESQMLDSRSSLIRIESKLDRLIESKK